MGHFGERVDDRVLTGPGELCCVCIWPMLDVVWSVFEDEIAVRLDSSVLAKTSNVGFIL